MSDGQSGYEREPGKEFGGLSPQEAGRKSAEKRRLERELREGDSQDRIVHALTERAVKGDPAAVRELRELNVLVPQTPDSRQGKSLLELLTRDQRACIELALRGEEISKDLALDAWCK